MGIVMDHTEQLFTLTEGKIRSLGERIRQIELIDFPSRSPRLLISMFKRILSALSTRLGEYEIEVSKETDSSIRRRLLAEVQDITHLVVLHMGAHLRYIEGASSERNPWNFVEPIEKLARTILRDAEFIVRPRWHYNFSIFEIVVPYKRTLKPLLSESAFRNIFGVQANPDDTLPEKVYVVSFPGLERDNVLLHVNLGHEIGHPIQDKFFARGSQSYLLTIQREVARELKKRHPNQTEMERLAMAAARAKEIEIIRTRALEELIADIFSLKLFGLAAIFALYEIPMLMGSFDDVPVPDGYYPPWRMRLREVLGEADWPGIRLILRALCEGDVAGISQELREEVVKCLFEHMDSLTNLTSKKYDKVNIKNKLYLHIAYKSVARATRRVRSFLKIEFGSHSCPQDEPFWRDVLYLVGRLDRRIPPNEIIDTEGQVRIADIRKILNAGWLYRLTRLSSTYADNSEYFQDIQTINNLVLKAVEISGLQEEYGSYKTAKGPQ